MPYSKKSCCRENGPMSSVDKKKIMSTFIGKAQEEYKEESQKTVSWCWQSKPNFSRSSPVSDLSN